MQIGFFNSLLLPNFPCEGSKMKETIVLYPAPSFHHMISVVELSKLILEHHPLFSITILVPTMLHDNSTASSYINSILSQTDLPMSFFSLGPLHTKSSDNLTGAAAGFYFIRLHIPLVLAALETISATSTILALITTDIGISRHISIPTFYYFTAGASSLVSIFYLPVIHKQTTKSIKDLPDDFPFHIPGLPPLKPSQLPEPLLDRAKPAYHEFLSFSSYIPYLKGIILNTFDLLEPRAIKAIAEGTCVPNVSSSVPPLYCIGPLIVDAKARGASDDAVSSCLQWLDRQPSRSVVFLCFGRRGAFSTVQLKEIAIGLERSQQRFMWVVRNPPPNINKEPDLEELLPEGLLERTKEKGVVVKSSAPQAAILSHESVGGFVTHCGWNSVLEAVSYGVPMISWPLYAEQRMNSVVLAEEMKLSIPINYEEGNDGLVRSEEVERRVRELMIMGSQFGQTVRGRSLKMKRMAMAAWDNNIHGGTAGSSFTAFSKLVASWKQEIV